MVQIKRFFASRSNLSISLMLIPLTLSAFTHLWNPIGFPTYHVDEGHYMRRTMQVMAGLGPQESNTTYDFPYDHPYFGQIFLASSLSLVNYPDSLNPSVNLHSIEMLYLVPRLIMGILAIVDTFLVYKISETRYNRKVAFISATLFAVVPFSWTLRRILLDSIELPFILLSILFAIYYAKSVGHSGNIAGNNKNILLLLLSGIFLGLAIFTKAPVFTMIPLVAFILLKKDKKDSKKTTNNHVGINPLKILAMWIAPVVLIPLIWPAYAISIGQLGEWLDGIIFETSRTDRPLGVELNNMLFRMEPVLSVIGILGLVYAFLKRDYFILLWIFPYFIFLFFVNWVYYFHLILVFSAFCIATTAFVIDILKKVSTKKTTRIIGTAVFGAIIIFAFINSTILVTQNINSPSFRLAALLTEMLPTIDSEQDDSSNKVTVIGSNGIFALFWIPSQVFYKNSDFKWFEERRDYIGEPIETKKYVIIADKTMHDLFLTSSKTHIKYTRELYDNSTLAEVLKYNASSPDLKKYPYTNILDDVSKENINRRGIDWGDNIEIKANY